MKKKKDKKPKYVKPTIKPLIFYGDFGFCLTGSGYRIEGDTNPAECDAVGAAWSSER